MIILANRFLSTGSDVTFTRQLRDSGQRAADEVVRVEDELLTLERAIANTEGVAAAVVRADAEDLRARILQLVVNANVDAVTILDREGTRFALHPPQPDRFPTWRIFYAARGGVLC